MNEYRITDSPDDPDVSLTLCPITAETPLQALDLFAVNEGFVPYSELPIEDGAEWHGVDEHGRTWGIFTNTTVWALPVTS